jgi:hypothetical protein
MLSVPTSTSVAATTAGAPHNASVSGSQPSEDRDQKPAVVVSPDFAMSTREDKDDHPERSQDDAFITTIASSKAADAAQRRRRALFGDCALVEIIHLHDCLRGALQALEKDLMDLSHMVLDGDDERMDADSPACFDPDKRPQQQQQRQLRYCLSLSELESRATARFQIIWSVFRAHSAAEDEFIWPALRLKTQGRIQGCCGTNTINGSGTNPSPPVAVHAAIAVSGNPEDQKVPEKCCGGNESSCVGGKEGPSSKVMGYDSCDDEVIEQEEYEEDHADEERMFTMMDHLLARLRKGLLHQRNRLQRLQQQGPNNGGAMLSGSPKTIVTSYNHQDSITDTMKEIQSLVKTLNQHLLVHLEKEEKQCMPLVVKHLSKAEIHDLVGKIMGKRSSDMIAQILTMAIQNLNESDKEEMVKHMKQAMVGTFFDRWLAASGWMDGVQKTNSYKEKGASAAGYKRAAPLSLHTPTTAMDGKRLKSDSLFSTKAATSHSGDEITSEAELEKLIRAVATNPSLTAVEKNLTIQGLRTSVWKRNQKFMGNAVFFGDGSHANASMQTLDLFPPAAYYKKSEQGETKIVWKASSLPSSTDNIDAQNNFALVPKFSKSDLAATYHDGSFPGQGLGCAHYARACKLRHPLSGRLYTCRLCCDQKREAPGNDRDEPLDRYAVSEVLCMKCKTLQPAAKECINPDCELNKQGFAKYYCDICHLYDDRPRPIFHCPYCNTCRLGHGLGIDYRHCMRCNACVSLSDKDHRCIPQKLQGSCPICYETLFSSTEPLKGLRCGHVMHLSCFTDYRRGQNYTCPLCMRSMEDMSDYFSLLDQAVRMQTMPAVYQNTFCNLYCQDCDKTGQCQYHFVGQKCPHCGSYNTREMGRFESSSGAS